MKSAKHLKTLIIIAITGGVLGGLGNYLMLDSEVGNYRNILKPIVLGIIAAAVIPLFLKLVSSNLLDIVDDNLRIKNYITFMSLCLLSALFSDVFLKGIYASVFNQIDNELRVMKAEINESNEKSDFVIKNLKSEQQQQNSPVTETIKDNKIKKIAKTLNLSQAEAKVYYQVAQNKISETKELYELGNKSTIDSTLKKLKKENLINEFHVDKAAVIVPKQIDKFTATTWDN